MGLDMYLTKKTYVGNKYKKPEEMVKVIVPKEIGKINEAKITYIEEEAGYWRKANAIHKWFVDNVQEGEDDCKEYYIDEEQMKELLAIINKILKSSKMVKGKVKNGETIKDGKWIPIMEDGEFMENYELAQELLPTQSGFFYGSTGYDQWYIDDLKLTKKILEEALKEGGEYYYSSSW